MSHWLSKCPFANAFARKKRNVDQRHGKKKSGEGDADENVELTWTDLLTATGPAIWTLRAKTFHCPLRQRESLAEHHQKEWKNDVREARQEIKEHRDKVSDSANGVGGDTGTHHSQNGHHQKVLKQNHNRTNGDRIVHLQVDPPRPEKNVQVYCHVHEFQKHEEDLCLDKFQPKCPVQSLTHTVGKEWNRQRQVFRDPVHGPIRNIKEESLRAATAAARVFQKLQQPSAKATNDCIVWKVDLKDLLLETVGEWAIYLFYGQEDAELLDLFVLYWSITRQRFPASSENVAKAKSHFVHAIQERFPNEFSSNHDTDHNRKKSNRFDTNVAANRNEHDGGEKLCTTSAAAETNQSSRGDTTGGGLMRTFFESDFSSPEEALENIIHAMTAASDATNCLIFWTLWNLVNHKENDDDDGDDNHLLWDLCQAEVQQDSQQEQQQTTTRTAGTLTPSLMVDRDLEQLAQLKVRATQGEPIQDILESEDWSVMGLALVETLRVFPPVWTLPRAWLEPNEAKVNECKDPVIAAKVDVITVNGVTDCRDWNPLRWRKCETQSAEESTIRKEHDSDDTTTDPYHNKILEKSDEQQNSNDTKEEEDNRIWLASFGVGKRTCPAGTAALWAARYLLHEFLQAFAALHEHQPGHALQNAYLGPTLATDGPQWFDLTCHCRRRPFPSPRSEESEGN